MAQNNKKSNIDILSISILPYCPSSRVATEFPAFESFTSRTQFIPFNQQTHVAVKLDLVNLTFENPRRRKSRKTFFINIRDEATGSIVASRTLCAEIDSDSLFKEERVDVPFRRSQLNPEHDYTVEATYAGRDEVLVSQQLHYITTTKLPTKYYVPVSAYVESGIIDNDCMPVPLRLSSIDSKKEGRTVTFLLENTVPMLRHRPELFMKFFDSDGKTIVMPCILIGKEEDGKVYVTARCDYPLGLNIGEHLYVELLSMGYHFAGALFDASGDDEEGELCGDDLEYIPEFTHSRAEKILEKRRRDRVVPVTQDLYEERSSSVLDSLVGLESVKAKLEGYRKLMEFYNLRRKIGLPVPSTPLHCMFLGSPGTGKTTVAKEMGRILHDCGALSKGHVVVRERASLLGQFYNSEAEKTLAALEEAKGGILFIDEAYQLHQPDDPKDPGRFVLETLMTALADTDNRDWMLILAGYTNPMLRMFSLNPGLASRIPEINFYRFDDYTEGELMEIAERYFSSRHFALTPGARDALSARLSADYANRNEGFGNGRHVVNMIETEILPAMASRVSTIERPSRADLTELYASDIPAPIVTKAPAPRRIGFAC